MSKQSPCADCAVRNRSLCGTLDEGELTTLSGIGHRQRLAECVRRGEAIMRLLCEGGIDLAQLAQGHGQAPDIFVSALPRLAELEQGGLVTREGWGIRLTASAFDAWRDGSVGTFSQAV